MLPRTRLAYVFERFPTFTQTFCAREVQELGKQGIEPAVFSIRVPTEEPPQDFPPGLGARTVYLPGDEEVTAEAKKLQGDRKLPRAMRRLLENWSSKRDKHRVYEAAWLGPRLKAAKVRHVHVHFAGIAARTAYWLKEYYGITYSITGHANDIFCEESDPLPVTLEDLIREAALVVTVSNYSARALKERFGLHSRKIHRVYNGIDTQRWKPGSLGMTKSEGDPLIVSVGRYIEKKGFSDLIAACALLRDRGQAFRCEIIGEGPLEAELNAQIETLGLNGKVVLTGPRRQEEILERLQQAAVFALPCVEERGGGKDNLPTVIMEAMSCGLPVVSTPIAGVPEMVIDGHTGSVVPERNPKATAEKLERWLGDPDSAHVAGKEGRERAQQEFDIRVTTAHLKRLLVSYGRIWPGMDAIKQDRSLFSAWLRGDEGK